VAQGHGTGIRAETGKNGSRRRFSPRETQLATTLSTRDADRSAGQNSGIDGRSARSDRLLELLAGLVTAASSL
jgi:hypothetical protein